MWSLLNCFYLSQKKLARFGIALLMTLALSAHTFATSINLGDVINDSIDSGTEVDEFEFSANAGDSLFFDAQAGSLANLAWVLTGPSSSNLFATDSFVDRGPIVLSESGDYTLRISSRQNRTDEYQVQVVLVPPRVPEAITLDTLISGEIAVQGQEQEFTFSLASEQVLYFDRLSGTSAARWILLNDDNEEVFNSIYVDVQATTLPASNYRLIVDGNGDDLFNYTFVVAAVPPVTTTPISLNEIVSGEIAVPGEIDEFTFTLTETQALFFDRLVGGSTSITWTLFDDSNAEVFTNGFWDDVELTQVPAGVYVLRLDGRDDTTLNYQFQIAVIPPTSSTPITLDVPIEGSIEVQGEVDEFTFIVPSDRELYFDRQAGASFSISWTLSNNNNEILFDVASWVDIEPTLIPSGEYVLRLDGKGDDRSNYQFQLHSVPETSVIQAELYLGAAGGIAIPGERQRFEFSLEQATLLGIERLSGTQGSNYTVRLFDENEVLLDTKTSFAASTAETVLDIQSAGTYFLEFDGNRDYVGQYNLRLWPLVQPDIENISLDTIQSFRLSRQGQRREYLFSASAGDPLYLNVDYRVTPRAWFSLYAPNGDRLFLNRTDDSSINSLPETGTYRLLVTHSTAINSIPTGNHSFIVSQTNDEFVEESAADLQITSASVNYISTDSPANIIVSYTVTNHGSAASNIAIWKDRIQFISDNEFRLTSANVANAFDFTIPIELENSQSLAPSESYSKTINLSLPLLGLSSESFDLVIEADVENQVYEGSSELNQFRSENPLIFFEEREISGSGVIRTDLAEGSLLPANTPIVLSGNANLSGGSVNVYFVMDNSASTSNPFGFDANGDGNVDQLDDFNGDGRDGDVLDVEISSILNIANQVQQNTDDVFVSVIPFNDNASALDLGPERFKQSFILPNEQSVNTNEGNLDFALKNNVGRLFGTNFDAAISEVLTQIRIAPPSDQNLIFFLTDGQALQTANFPDLQALAEIGVSLFAFQINNNAITPSLQNIIDVINTNPNSIATGQSVVNPGDLPDLILQSLALANVEINGVAAQALDAAGNFFSQIILNEGPNVISISALDNEDNRVEKQITLFGAVDDSDSDSSFEASQGEVLYDNVYFNRSSNRLFVDAKLKNNGSTTISNPVSVNLQTDPNAVTLSNADGQTANGQSIIVFDDELGAGLAPDESSTAREIIFTNPRRDRFVIFGQALTQSNSQPYFVSSPIVSVPEGNLYVYNTTAIDQDNDALVYGLSLAPQGMQIDEETGTIEWLPLPNQAGTHLVALEVSDGKGGIATQTFQLSVTNNQPNLAPFITSTPEVSAIASEGYVYQIVAVDPEGSSLQYLLDTAAIGFSINPTSGLISATADAVESASVNLAVTVIDADGGQAQQNWVVDFKQSNQVPVITSLPQESTSAETRYSYAVQVDDDDIDLRYQLNTAPMGMSINASTGVISMLPTSLQIGAHAVSVQVTDPFGASTQQDYTLTVSADAELPQISIVVSSTTIALGDSAIVTVVASDNAGIQDVTLSYNGLNQILDANNSVLITPSAAGEYALIANVIDINDLSNQDEAILRVIDTNDITAPAVTISSPAPRSTASFLTDIIGSVEADDLLLYELQYALASEFDPLEIASSGPQWTTFAQSNQTVDNSLLGVFDPTILRNDDYVVRLIAYDINGNTSAAAISIGLQGESKIGVFELAYTDLAIPVSNIPIQIKRIYRSTDAAVDGELGYGWHLQLSDPDIRETVPVADMEESLGLFVNNAFTANTRVYLNAPDGKRIGFTFEPEPVGTLLGTSFIPKFVPDPGVYYELEVDPVTISQSGDGSFVLFLIPFNYNPQDYTLVEPNGTRWEYNQFRGLSKVRDRNDNELVYTDEGIFHSSGVAVTFERDNEGRISTIVDPSGQELRYSYNSLGELTSFTDRIGQTEYYDYLVSPQHFMQQITDANGNTTRLEFDDNGRLAASVNALGERIRQDWDTEGFSGTITDALGQVTVLDYDERGNIVREQDPMGGVKEYSYDENNNTSSMRDENGNTTYYTYDNLGNVTSITDASGNIHLFGFDEFANRTSVVNALGHSSTSEYDDNGNLLRVIMPNGGVLVNEYDSDGRVISTTDPEGNQTRYEYTSSFITPTKITLPDNNVLLRTLNNLGQIISTTDELGKITTLERDASGRIIKQTDANNHEFVYVYDNNLLVAISYPNGVQKFFEYDANDQVTTTRYDDGTQVLFRYDANQNLIEVTDINGNITRYGYDALNRKILRTDASGASESYAYDSVGNLISKTDRRAYTINYGYDTLNRQVSEQWLDENDAVVWQLNTIYDAVGNVVNMNDGTSEISNTYDANRRVVAHAVSISSGPSSTLTMTYDNNDKLIAVSDASSTQSMTYNSRKLLDSTGLLTDALALPNTSLSVDIAYDPRGLRASVTRNFGNTAVGSSTYEFNERELGKSIRHQLAGTLYSFDYIWDENRRVASQTQNAESFNYVYDSRDQLNAVNRSEFADEQYSFDANGNPTENAVIGEANRLLVMDDIEYSFDTAGNMVERFDNATGQTAKFGYDHRNRLITIEVLNSADEIITDIQYGYDALDRRVKRSVNNNTEYTNYVMQDAWTDMQASGEVKAVYLNGALSDEKLARVRDGEAAWYMTDKQQTVYGIVDSNGNIINEIDYDAFGKIINESNPIDSDRFSFTGRELERSVNIYDYRARVYDPVAQRFYSEDPIEFAANDANLYRYVFNNPLQGTDPSGKNAAMEYGQILCEIAVPQIGQFKALGQCLSDLYDGIAKAVETTTSNNGLVPQFGGCVAGALIDSATGAAHGHVDKAGAAAAGAINAISPPGGPGPGGGGGGGGGGAGGAGDAAISMACGAL